MPQGDYISLFRKRFGYQYDWFERLRKKEARLGHKRSAYAQKVTGLRAKLYNKKRFKEKAELRKKIRIHEENMARKNAPPPDDDGVKEGARPAYLLDRKEAVRTKVLSNMVKQKKAQRAGKWEVPLPKVRPISEAEMFGVVKSGKRKKKAWKRMVRKVTYVGENFTRKPPKYERFIRPMALRMKRANVTHPDLKRTFQLDILGVKKNPQGPMFSSLGVITKGTIIEVNVADLGLVTQTGKVVWSKYCQVTNNPENDGCINAVLLV